MENDILPIINEALKMATRGEVKVSTRTCPNCNGTWIPRVENPKECPICKVRLDRDRKEK